MGDQAIDNPFESQAAPTPSHDSSIENPFETAAPVQAAPVEKPGMLDTLKGAFKNASFKNALTNITNTDPIPNTVGGTSLPGAEHVANYASHLWDNVKRLWSAGTPEEAKYQGANAVLSAIPDVGEAASNAGQNISQGKYGAAAFDAAKALGETALSSVGSKAESPAANVAARAKKLVTVPEDVKATIAEYEKTAPQLRAAISNPEDIATAGRTAKDINAAATARLQANANQELAHSAVDAKAEIASALGQAPEIDASSHSVSANADRIGTAYRSSAQQIYKRMDELNGGHHFQDLSAAVETATKARKAALTMKDAELAEEALKNARQNLDDFANKASESNVNLKQLKGMSDKLWSKGMSFDEIAYRVGKAERVSGHLKPSGNPLDSQVRDLTAEANNRGHVLKNAMGDRAQNVLQHTIDAGEQTARESAAASAARARINTAKGQLSTLEGRYRDADRVATKIDKTRWRIGAGAAAALGVSTTGVKAAQSLYGKDH